MKPRKTNVRDIDRHMKAMRSFSYWLLLVSSVVVTTTAYARPWLYVSGFTHGGSADECLQAAKEVLAKNGFKDELEIERYEGDSKNKGGFVTGELADAPVTAQIECNATEGLTTLGVSGLDNELTYKKYDDLFEAEW